MPHCAAPWLWNARCKAPPLRVCDGKPSTVVISYPPTCPAAVRQEQTGAPSTRTVQAPQSPASQPIFVPIRPRSSRKTCDRRFVAAAATRTSLPLTLNESSGATSSMRVRLGRLHERPSDQLARGVHAIRRGCADVIDRRKRGEFVRTDRARNICFDALAAQPRL